MVLGVVADVAGDVLLFQAADAVHQPRRAGNRPGPGQPLVARVGLERRVAARARGMLDRVERQILGLGNLPGLGAVGDVAVGQQHDRRHEPRGDPPGFLSHREAVGRAAGRQHRHRALAVAAKHGLEQVGLLGLGGQAGARAAALDIDDHQRQLGHHGQADGLGLQRDARPAGSRHAHRPAERGADGGGDGRDFILGLKGANAEVLELDQLVQDVAGRRDRVTAVEDLGAAPVRGRDQPPGHGLIAGDVAVLARRQLGLGHRIVAGHGVGGFAVVVAGVQGPAVGLGHRRALAELVGDIAERGLERAIVEPERQPHCVEVLAAVGFLLTEAQARHGQPREPGHFDREELVAVEAAVFQRIGLVAGLLHSLLVERIFVDDQDAAVHQVHEVGDQGRRVHRHQSVDLIARREDLGARKADLKSAHAGFRAARGANLGRKVGKGRHVVAGQGRRVGQLRAGQLHAIARVTAKPDGRRLDCMQRLAAGNRCHGTRGGGGVGTGGSRTQKQSDSSGARTGAQPQAAARGNRARLGRAGRHLNVRGRGRVCRIARASGRHDRQSTFQRRASVCPGEPTRLARPVAVRPVAVRTVAVRTAPAADSGNHGRAGPDLANTTSGLASSGLLSNYTLFFRHSPE